MSADLTLMHLMCTKFCHDLAAPLGAIAMGLEMLEDELNSDSPDMTTRDLLARGTQSAVARLELFRCLSGFSSTPEKPGGREVEKVLKDYWSDEKIRLTWQIDNLEDLQGPLARLVLAILLIAADSLPRGGSLIIHSDLSVDAQGPVVSFRENVIQTLKGSIPLAQQTMSTVIAFLAFCLANHLGRKFSIDASHQNQFQIKI